MLFNPTRDQARQFLFDSWRKHQAGELLTPLENMAAQLITRHPEFQPVVEQPERYQDQDFLPEHGAPNPFLHLMMHIAIEEQVSIDQPGGVRSHYLRLTRQYGSEHDAQHRMMECLAEMMLQAQRQHSQPDPALYFACLARQ